MTEVVSYFQSKADELSDRIRVLAHNFGPDHPEVARNKKLRGYFAAIAKAAMGKEVT